MTTPQPDGYLALPATTTGPAVLVLHAWWGLNDTITALCQRLAAAGFVAFAPDLYHGHVTDQIAEAETLATTLESNPNQAHADVAAAIAFLRGRAGADDTGLAVIGFSLGAAYALTCSITAPDAIRSVVVFYGTAPGDYGRARADYLGHFAAVDPYEPAASAAALERELKRVGRSATFYTYPATGHWFFEQDRADAYHPAAANLAWERTLAFLRRC